MRRHGYRILGSIHGERRLVNSHAALAGYAACDLRAEVEQEAYLSAFDFGDDFRQYLTQKQTTKGYAGPCGAAYLWWDVDREDAPDVALRDTQALVLFLVERYQLADEHLLVFFSGGKGYHVGLPTALWTPEPGQDFAATARLMAEAVASLVPGGGVEIDTGIYDRVRAFRAPNSRHPKTRLHKRRLTMADLHGLEADRIADLARTPQPFDLPAPSCRCEKAGQDWADSVAEWQRRQQAAKARADRDEPERLNRVTLDFIREGADKGHRHQRLFSAAANLADFGCPSSLAHALLLPSALDSGLAPADARRQIDNGLKRAGGKDA